MKEFKDAINRLEVGDLCCTGFHFTWTKSLKNPHCSTLKKLDRILINDDFNQSYDRAHGVFLPYLVSDHSPAVLIFLEGFPKKPKSFRFTNYIANKIEFMEVVEKGWDFEVKGCKMFQFFKKLKNLKKTLNNLNWKNGNLFEKVKMIEEDLKKAQYDVDHNPYDEVKMKKAVYLYSEYIEAASDELKLLQQKVKIQ